MRNLIISAALVAASLFGVTAQAAEAPAAPYVELANPVPVAEPGKIEVVELFWYGCPHCYAFEPVINPWVEKLPSDVNFVRIPAMFGGPWDAHGQMFLTLEAMGVEHKVHAAVFNAIQKEHKKLTDKNDMADFLATQGGQGQVPRHLRLVRHQRPDHQGPRAGQEVRNHWRANHDRQW